MEVISFPVRDATTSVLWNMSEEEKDQLAETKKLYVACLENEDGGFGPFQWICVSTNPIPAYPDIIPFNIELSTPWQAPAFIPFVPQNMYEDFVRHRELWVNMKNNKGIFFTTYQVKL